MLRLEYVPCNVVWRAFDKDDFFLWKIAFLKSNSEGHRLASTAIRRQPATTRIEVCDIIAAQSRIMIKKVLLIGSSSIKTTPSNRKQSRCLLPLIECVCLCNAHFALCCLLLPLALLLPAVLGGSYFFYCTLLLRLLRLLLLRCARITVLLLLALCC